MGCDIHTHIEYKKTINGKSKWLCGDYFIINPRKGEDDEKDLTRIGFCDDRNYSLFATLANVRNYGNTAYISEPKGLPQDITEEVKQDAEEWDSDGHSHSYFTLKELLDWQKNAPPLKYSGMISQEAQKLLDENGILPEEWCQLTNETGWVKRQWQHKNNVLLPLIEAMKQRANQLYLIYDFLWEEERYNEAYELSDRIRIVFWFDN